jgi:putative membrane protein
LKNTLFLAVPLLTIAALSAHAAPPAPGTKSEAMSATKDKLGHAVGVVSAEMTTTTKGFVTAAATTDMYEVEAAKIAATRSHGPMVKTFANTMITAHSKTTNQLKSIVADEKLAAALPVTLDARRQSMIDNLRGAKDEDFDERYIGQQVDAHEEALILMRGYHNSGDNASLKKFAGVVENAVKAHLSMAKRLDKKHEAMEEKDKKH